MPEGKDNKINNNSENKFPNEGNFSASQNNAGNNLGKTQNITNSANNNINQQINQEKKITDNPDNKIDSAQKEILKKGIQTAADAYIPGSGKLAKAAMNTKLGNKAVNAVNELSKNPAVRTGQKALNFLSKKSQIEEDEEDQEEFLEVDEYGNIIEENDTLIPKEVSNKVIPAAIITAVGCFGGLIFLVIIIFIIISPIFFVQNLINSAKEGISGFFEGIGYFFRGCANEQECREKEQDSFYETINEVYNDYQSNYNVTLDTDLITATLTYYNPLDTGDANNTTENLPSNAVDFRKSEKKIKDLAKNMVSEGKTCITESGKVLAQYKDNTTACPQSDEAVSSESWFYVDEDKYRSYLEDTFIRKFYFNNEKNDDIDKKVKQVVDDIYERVEFVKYLNSSQNSSGHFLANNSQVVIMNCTGTIELETVSLYEYLQGVLYVEGYATARSEEFLKVQAIISKNYLYAINNATPDSIPTTLKVRSCQMNQEYCSVEKGCHDMDDGNQSGHDSWDTIVSGPDANGGYFRAPLSDVATLEKIKSAIDSTLNEFIVKDGKFVMTQYRASCSGTCDSTTNVLDQKVANEMINSGNTYKDVLGHFYDGDIVEIDLGSAGYPLDLIYNNVTSAFGWRVHPIKHYCRSHGGTDIAAPADANIYAIADAVVVSNSYSSSYGNVTILGHGQKDSSGHYEYYSLYAHQIRLSSRIHVGEKVKAGQVIGNVGSTGDSTGNHLHIEIYRYVNNKKVGEDAVNYFKGVKLTGQVGGALYGSEAECQRCVNTKGVNNC